MGSAHLSAREKWQHEAVKHGTGAEDDVIRLTEEVINKMGVGDNVKIAKKKSIHFILQGILLLKGLDVDTDPKEWDRVVYETYRYARKTVRRVPDAFLYNVNDIKKSIVIESKNQQDAGNAEERAFVYIPINHKLQETMETKDPKCLVVFSGEAASNDERVAELNSLMSEENILFFANTNPEAYKAYIENIIARYVL